MGGTKVMEIILYVSIALVAVAFAVLVYFLVQTLKALKHTLQNVASTLEGVEKQLRGVTVETTELLHKTNRLAEDIQVKSESLNSLFVQVKDVGTSLNHLNQSFRKVTTKVAAASEQQSEQVSKVLQWSDAALKMWQKWQINKKEVDGKVK
jgi:uncharacterized protein YoxC